MSNKKEIDVWVDKKVADDRCPELNHVIYLDERVNMTKARLIIEMPEKKIEITESQFDEVWEDRVGYNSKDIKKLLGF